MSTDPNEWVKRQVEAAPPLSDAQREALAAIMRRKPER